MNARTNTTACSWEILEMARSIETAIAATATGNNRLEPSFSINPTPTFPSKAWSVAGKDKFDEDLRRKQLINFLPHLSDTPRQQRSHKTKQKTQPKTKTNRTNK
mmetsp:Transcript_627/g.1534  ORF Transcript_627/g.1534 Transcript_627/m.1534 type:complete len:104 (+) Transcript_627:379-690(+)